SWVLWRGITCIFAFSKCGKANEIANINDMKFFKQSSFFYF
ncbi:MAG: hypothetical protein ACI96N_003488, partial [Arenicella sp.]